MRACPGEVILGMAIPNTRREIRGVQTQCRMYISTGRVVTRSEIDRQREGGEWLQLDQLMSGQMQEP